MANTPSRSLPDDGSEAVVDKQRSIQQQQDGKDTRKSEKDDGVESKKPPVQVGLTQQPEPPHPAQHLEKPGLEANMQLKPFLKSFLQVAFFANNFSSCTTLATSRNGCHSPAFKFGTAVRIPGTQTIRQLLLRDAVLQGRK